jgi:ATP/ADP translocase
MEKKYYESSSGSGLSATIGGLSIAGVVPVVMMIINIFGWNISQAEITQVLAMTVQIAGTTVALFGLVRKIYYKIKK